MVPHSRMIWGLLSMHVLFLSHELCFVSHIVCRLQQLVLVTDFPSSTACVFSEPQPVIDSSAVLRMLHCARDCVPDCGDGNEV